jgi:phosphoglycerate kinase
MKLKRLEDLNIKNKRVLLRAPLNIPISSGKVGDTMRLKAVLPTLKYLLGAKAAVILISHHSKEGQSLAPVAPVLAKLIDKPVAFAADSIGPQAADAVAELKPGQVLMLENLRFHPEEEANKASFARALAKFGQAYVDDDFTVMHRAHASVVGLPKLLPSAAGYQVQKEVETITSALDKPARPLFAVVGGAKISTKIPLIRNLLQKVDFMLIGGAMANTFLAAQGQEVGKSLYEPDQFQTVRDIMDEAIDKGVSLFIPDDVIVTHRLTKAGKAVVKLASEVESNEIIADIGPATTQRACDTIHLAGTIIWNGPVGVAELPQFAKSSKKLAKTIADSPAISIVGGGDTAAFLDKLKMADQFSFVSTGGGASLELMAGQKLPGLVPLLKK